MRRRPREATSSQPRQSGLFDRLYVCVSAAAQEAPDRCHHLRRCTQARMCLLDVAVEEVVDAVERRLAVETTRV